MRQPKEDSACSSDQVMSLNLAVEELSCLASKELKKLLKDSENFTIQLSKENGPPSQFDMERVASSLPLHLIAVLVSGTDDVHLTHILHGVRLLHSLSDLASRHSRFEQILLDDVRVTEQILDLVFYTLIILGSYEQVQHLGSSSLPFLHPVLVACTLYLLTAYISTQWQDLVHILLAHPKVDIFVDVAFDAAHVDILLLHVMLSTLNNDMLCNKSTPHASELTAQYFCQQCEASLQFLLSLCQQKLFRDHLIKNKELCRNGGILSLIRTTLRLHVPDSFKESSNILAAVSRLKAKVLSIMLQLCEAESISYLDEIASSSKAMSLAKSVALEIRDLLKSAFKKDTNRLVSSLDRNNPRGLVLLNSMHLADIFSDDSNFRSFFMINIIPVLVEILVVPHEDFLSDWCSVNIAVIEEDANLEYDPFTVAGVALASLARGCGNSPSIPTILNENILLCTSNFNSMPLVSYIQQRSSYLIKIIANLHCFVPNICEEEERDLFLNKFHECLTEENESSSRYPSEPLKASAICKNLSSLSDYATSLIPNLLNDEDVLLLSGFGKKLQDLFSLGSNPIQEPLVKDEGTAESNIEDSYPVQNPLESSNMFPFSHFNENLVVTTETRTVFGILNTIGNHFESDGYSLYKLAAHVESKDGQSTKTDALPIARYLSATAFEETSNLKNNTDLKVRGSQSSSFQEVDCPTVGSKRRDLLEHDGPEQKKVRNTISETWSTSGSLKGVEKERKNFKASDMEVDSTKCEPDQISDGGDFFKVPDYTKESSFQEDEKVEIAHGEEKQPKKRKRNIMNDTQIMLIEKALLEEPEMQRNASLLQIWADKLCTHGSEVTSSQLKNWLNNRKARLARAAREPRGIAEGETAQLEKPSGSSATHFEDSPESPGEEYLPPTRGNNVKSGGVTTGICHESEKFSQGDQFGFTVQYSGQMRHSPTIPAAFAVGQSVTLVDREGKEVGKGKVYQVEGKWHGKSLEDAGLCVVNITELKVEKWKEVPHPSESAGMTFEKAAAKNGGVARVAWEVGRLFHSHL